MTLDYLFLDASHFSKTGSGYHVSLEHSGETTTREFDLVVHSAGRTSELAGLDSRQQASRGTSTG